MSEMRRSAPALEVRGLDVYYGHSHALQGVDLAVPEGEVTMLLGRDFTASAPDRVWLADLTYIWTAEGWLYVAVVIDAFSRRENERARHNAGGRRWPGPSSRPPSRPSAAGR